MVTYEQTKGCMVMLSEALLAFEPKEGYHINVHSALESLGIKYEELKMICQSIVISADRMPKIYEIQQMAIRVLIDRDQIPEWLCECIYEKDMAGITDTRVLEQHRQDREKAIKHMIKYYGYKPKGGKNA